VLKFWDRQIYESIKDELTIERVIEQIAARINLTKEEDTKRSFEEEE
jgi:hypothetical protein